MIATKQLPHFLLFSESKRAPQSGTRAPGQWRFILEELDGSARLEAGDVEWEVKGERLALLSVIRGLEALNQPSRVTLITPSRYVSRGFRFGLAEWRENDWKWERFGQMIPVKNADLWRRIDRTLAFHAVECRTMQFSAPASDARQPSRSGNLWGSLTKWWQRAWSRPTTAISAPSLSGQNV